MESDVTEGDSPVNEMNRSFWMEFPSNAGHEKSRRNLGGPSPKAKYYLATDSELVP